MFYLVLGILEHLQRPEAMEPLEALLFGRFTLATWQTFGGTAVNVRHISWPHCAKHTWRVVGDASHAHVVVQRPTGASRIRNSMSCSNIPLAGRTR